MKKGKLIEDINLRNRFFVFKDSILRPKNTGHGKRVEIRLMRIGK